MMKCPVSTGSGLTGKNKDSSNAKNSIKCPLRSITKPPRLFPSSPFEANPKTLLRIQRSGLGLGARVADEWVQGCKGPSDRSREGFYLYASAMEGRLPDRA